VHVQIKRVLLWLLPAADIVLSPFVYLSALLLKLIRTAGVQRFSYSRRMLFRAGCFPVRDHYYEPAFDNENLRGALSQDRQLPGIDWNRDEQLHLLGSFCCDNELDGLPHAKIDDYEFYLDNGYFGPGDAEYWYNLIRLKKPKRIIEVGSGYSTLMAVRAVQTNKGDDPLYRCEHIVIEPYENHWLERLNIKVVREKIEDLDMQMFQGLEANDILFIDSSHIVRPRGDIVVEYLELLPALKAGVIVHIHDIFSPRDYPADWIVDKVYFWNEQYLLEAFLTSNIDWKVIGALNYLCHNHFDKLKAKCPFLTHEQEPGSFYIQRVNARP
jgi:predicted O-methyltransferase YrrM